MPHINRTSSLRGGFAYQDFWGLRLAEQWLTNPEQYKWIQFETCPDDTDANKFYLDDIVCLDSDDLYHFYQIKYRQNLTDKWNWDKFLVAERPKGTSLLNKWAKSLESRLDKTKEVFFITNGNIEEDIGKYLNDDILDIEKVKKQERELYDRIVGEVGEEKIDQIFQLLRFKFKQEDLSDDKLEESIRSSFYKSLNATEAGVTKLYHEISKESRKRNPVQISLDLLRGWCEFDTPRPLEEEFDIPDDFEFFDDNTHKAILSDLQKIEGGIKIFFGKPGVGKSVYLSKLADELSHEKIKVVKHHYHISPDDPSPQDRLNSKRIIESFKFQFKQYKEDLGNLSNKNSKNIPISEYISTIASKQTKEKKAFVIVIDGLDHVLRYGSKEELEDFLREVCVPQLGVWIIVGMQEIAKPHLPQIVIDKCPEEQWIEIKGLSERAVSKLVAYNKSGLNLPEEKEQLDSLITKLFSLTSGNPLHLRYSLLQLKNNSAKTLVTEYSCRDLILYSDDIEKYYTTLWNQTTDNAKTLLLAIASVNFSFNEQQLIECISSWISNPSDITTGFHQVSHLISRGTRNQISVFHNSFELFLKNRPEMSQQRIAIKTNIKKWLEQSSYENLKWAELRLIEYELGDNRPLLEIDRNWLIDAIAHPRNISQINTQLELCSEIAKKEKKFGQALKISHLNTYYKNARDFVDTAAGLIWDQSIKLNPEFVEELVLKDLSSDTLITVANIANKTGKLDIISEIIGILQNRLDNQSYRKGEIPQSTKAILSVLPLESNHKIKKVHEYIIQFRDLKISATLYQIYAQKMLELDQKAKISQLLNLDLMEEERKAILQTCLYSDFKRRESEYKEIISIEGKDTLLEKLYLILSGVQITSLPELPESAKFPSTIKEYGDERAIWTKKFHDYFIIALIYGLCDKEEDIHNWIKSATTLWPVLATKNIFRAALKISESIATTRDIEYKDVISSIKNTPELIWPDDRDRLEFKQALTEAIKNILTDIVFIKKFLNQTIEIDETNYNEIVSTPFFKQHNAFRFNLDLDLRIFNDAVFQRICQEKKGELENTVNYLSERSEDYSNLSQFLLLYGHNTESKDLLNKSVDNYLGHGYHKDTYLFDVLETMELCAEAQIDATKLDNWTQRIIPIISNIGKCTDGDETNHLPNYLADFLSKYNRNLLYKFYYSLADKEELYPAQEIFKYVVRSLPFDSELEVALASTALDKDSYAELKEKAKNSKGAETSLEIINNYFGEIFYKDDDYSTSPPFSEEKVDFSKIGPDHLEHHLDELESKWDLEKYITGWTLFWLKKKDKSSIYTLIKNIIDKKGAKSTSGELLDILYPLSYELDSNKTFELLCFAQINNQGWDRYWTDKRKAINRWSFLKEKYPSRYLEFFEETVKGGFPLARGVEFFIFFNDKLKAQEIANAAIEFSEGLMANQNLEKPDWAYSSFEKIDKLDLLFQRLVWPSSLVRERAATAISELIGTSDNKKLIYNKLLSWISGWKIETIVAIGILPIVKAFQKYSTANDVSCINVLDITKSIKVNSIVIEKLLEEISGYTGEAIGSRPSYSAISQLPQSYSADVFFNKHIKTILAPIYLVRAKEIEKRSFQPFGNIWAHTAKNLALSESIELESNHYFYGRHQDDEFLIGFSSKVGEIYRSAFLRTLFYFYKNKYIPQQIYYEYAFATLPVELSFWNISPNRMPVWWPSLINQKISKEGLFTFSLVKPTEDIIKHKDGDKIILAAEGAIKPPKGWCESPMHSFTLIGFGYKAIGPKLPQPEQISEEIVHWPVTAINATVDNPLSFLKNSKDFLTDSDAIQINDLLIFPLVSRNWDLTISLWQYFKDKNQSFNIVDELREDLEVEINDKRWSYKNTKKDELVCFEEWLEGLQERYKIEMPIPHGHQIFIDESYLTKKLKGNGLRLGYILTTTTKTQEYSHGKVKNMTTVKLLNVSNIIIP